MGKQFRMVNVGKNGNPMTWYKFKKLLNEGCIVYEN